MGVGFEGSVTDPDDLTALIEAAHERYGRIDAVVDDETKDGIPMGRTKTTEIADTIGYLLSPAASYGTGQNVRVDDRFTSAV